MSVRIHSYSHKPASPLSEPLIQMPAIEPLAYHLSWLAIKTKYEVRTLG